MRRIGSALSPGEVGWGDAIAHSDRGTLTITEADHTLAIRNFSGRLPVRSKDTGQLLDTLLASGSFRALQTPEPRARGHRLVETEPFVVPTGRSGRNPAR